MRCKHVFKSTHRKLLNIIYNEKYQRLGGPLLGKIDNVSQYMISWEMLKFFQEKCHYIRLFWKNSGSALALGTVLGKFLLKTISFPLLVLYFSKELIP